VYDHQLRNATLRENKVLIICEGPDQGGKTTLAAKLADRLRLPLSHSGGPCRSQLDALNRIRKIMDDQTPRVMDRIPCISERIYGPVLRQIDYFHDSDFLRQIKCLTYAPVIYCRPPLKYLLDIKARGEHDTPEHIEPLKKHALECVTRYDELMAGIDHIHYDFTTASLQSETMLVNWLSCMGGL
jgi:hypothetical protein